MRRRSPARKPISLMRRRTADTTLMTYRQLSIPQGANIVVVTKDELPRTWRHVGTIYAGGLTELGFTQDERYLLLLSHNGRGLIDTETGERVARDYQEPSSTRNWIDESRHTIEAIGPLDGVAIPCVGIWGGALFDSADGWRLQVNGPKADEFCLVEERTGQSWRLTSVVTEVRAHGFSASGGIAIVATSSEVELYRRTA
jgi:hypothetical protein